MNAKELKFRKKLGAKIQEMRQKRNLTQTDLSALLGFKDYQSLARIENGRVTTSIYNIYIISLALECTIQDLFEDI